ncbi:Thioesterase [Hyphomicrobiales bacterium]|nr:Thioesterase [Hyphomicrobiales bacterium]CAH1691850.1 Thioesterase [Hyphomicrobiales bacterium]
MAYILAIIRRVIMSRRQAPLARGEFLIFIPILTRWADNDVYGHINNVTYYSFFDTAINRWLIERNHLDINTSSTIGVVVETGCTYFESISFPDNVEVGLSVNRIGVSSVRYSVGVFKVDSKIACAQGHFTHVYVDRLTRRPVEISEKLRLALENISKKPDRL